MIQFCLIYPQRTANIYLALLSSQVVNSFEEQEIIPSSGKSFLYFDDIWGRKCTYTSETRPRQSQFKTC